jgi:glycine dehydrogenase subunit 1
MSYLPVTEKNRKEMLKVIGVSSMEELISGSIPDELRLKEPLALPPPLSELEALKLIENLAAQNEHTGTHVCFLGGGAYDHWIPAAIGHITGRPEFYTAYTPYQPEVSQGTLQAIYEYQSMICELTGMDVANASMYDGASALAEAALLALGHTDRNEILVSKSVHPFHRRVVATYCHRTGATLREIPLKDGVTDVDALRSTAGSSATAGILIQHPNFFGLLEPVDALADAIHEKGGLLAASVDPISLGVLKPPGEFGADVAVGEGQPLGLPLNFGGPYLGLFAVRQNLVRRMPGRLAGVTRDAQGRRGFVLTLQTREQHIRREKAASSICTNQQLCALGATVYLALLGKTGLPKVADLCVQKAHYLAGKIAELPGFKPLFPGPFFKEFAVSTPVPPKRLIRKMREEGFFAGVDLGRFDYGIRNGLLIAVTEKRTREEMDRFVSLLKKHFVTSATIRLASGRSAKPGPRIRKNGRPRRASGTGPKAKAGAVSKAPGKTRIGKRKKTRK